MKRLTLCLGIMFTPVVGFAETNDRVENGHVVARKFTLNLRRQICKVT